MEARIIALEKRADESDSVHKEILQRLNKKDIEDAVLRQQLDTLINTTNRIEDKLTEHTEKPIKRQDSLITSALTTIIGLIIGAIFTLILKK